MRHRKVGKKLDRTADSRRHLRRQLAINFIKHGEMRTTKARATYLRPYLERLITMSRTATLQSRRLLLQALDEKSSVERLLTVLGPKYAKRSGGYTRTVALNRRKGDGAELVMLSLVE
jgi:large subunit ribosomal protein L17